MAEIVIFLLISGLLLGVGIAIKFGKAYELISGYNTAPAHEKEFMIEKGLGDFVGRQLMITAAAPVLGLILHKSGFVWGIEVGMGLLLILVFYMAFAVQRFNPPPSDDPKSIKRARSRKRLLIATMIFAVLVCGGVGISIALTSREPQITPEADQLVISGSYGVSINYADIDKLEFKTALPEIGVKNNGLNLGPILKGHFDVKGLGPSLLFLRSNQGPVVVIYRSGRQPVLINFTDPQQTQALYEQLLAKTGK
ncbi:MAG: DUF3784 domain-containing protein [Syntrophomonas sp.]